MAYKVLKNFRDTTDNKKLVKKSDSYEHKNAERIARLIDRGFLEEQDNQPPQDIKHTGGGWYELPNGEKVQGKENAQAALNDE